MKYWIAVASAEHVEQGKLEGFMQVCHGKAGPLKRIKAKDKVVYYSSVKTFRGKDKVQAFTAIGEALNDRIFDHDMRNGFVPFRRDMAWYPAQYAPIRPLLDYLAFSRGKKNWAYPMRFGLFEICQEDYQTIAHAMQVTA